MGSIPTASTMLIALPTGRARHFVLANEIGLRTIGAFTLDGSLRDPSPFTPRRSPAVSIPTASTKSRSQFNELRPGFVAYNGAP